MNFCFYICNVFEKPVFTGLNLNFRKMDIVDRLIAFKEFTGLTNSQFADRAGIPRPTLSQFLNGRNKRFSDDMTAKLHTAYPELNVMWLLFGEGDMVTDANIQFSEPENVAQASLFDAQEAQPQQVMQSQTPEETHTEIQANENENALAGNFHREQSGKASRPDNEPKNFSIEPSADKAPVVPTDPAKRIHYIMVFYSDNSYEIFTPSSER